jgi:hypothetical protein
MNAFDDLPIPEPVDDSVPRWVKERDYPTKHEEMLRDLYQAAWWQELCQLQNKKGESKPGTITPKEWLDVIRTDYDDRDWQMLEHEIGSAAARNAMALADVLRGDFETVFYEAAWKVSNKILWAGGRQEYDSFEEFLVDSVPRLKEPGHETELCDLLFMMKHFLPMMKQVGGDYEPEKLMELPNHWGRARCAVPYLRTKVTKLESSAAEIEAGTEKGQALIKEFQQAVDNVVEVIADDNIPRRGPTGVARILLSMDGGERPKPAQGHIAILPGKVLVFFVVEAGWQRAVENSLGSMVAFDSIDPELGFRQLDGLLHPKTQTERPIENNSMIRVNAPEDRDDRRRRSLP